jgi:hypothetical protein
MSTLTIVVKITKISCLDPKNDYCACNVSANNCWQVHISCDEEEELPLGVEAAINEDVFDLDDLEEEELPDEEGEGDGMPSIASTTFYSTMREVSLLVVHLLVFRRTSGSYGLVLWECE